MAEPKAILRIPVVPTPRTALHILGTTSPCGEEYRWSAMEDGLGNETRFYEPPLRAGERVTLAGCELVVESFELIEVDGQWEWVIEGRVRQMPSPKP